MNKFFINFLVITLLLIAFGVVAKVISRPTEPEAKIYFFDVGQGDAALIQKGETQILIDGGPDDKILEKLGQKMPVGDKKIEYLVLTHPHTDHLDGINEVLDNYNIGTLYGSGVVYTTNAYIEFLSKVKDKNIEFIVPSIGSGLTPFDEADLRFYWPGEKFKGQEIEIMNDSSVVNKFCYKSHCALFAGDAESDAQKNILFDSETDLKSEILKVPHHGSNNALVPDFYRAVGPNYAIISVGAMNSYGHPHAETLGYIQDGGIKLLRTDENGDIVCSLVNSWQCVGSK